MERIRNPFYQGIWYHGSARPIPPRMVVSGHPRLFFTKEKIPQLRLNTVSKDKGQVGISSAEIWEDILGVARNMLKQKSLQVHEEYSLALPEPEQPNPRREIDEVVERELGYFRPYWTHVCNNLDAHLETLSFVYIITEDEAFMEHCRRMMLAISRWERWCDERPAGCKPSDAPCDLSTWLLTTGISTAFDLLYDRLSEDDRAEIREAVIEKGLTPIYDYSNAGIDHLEFRPTILYNPFLWPNWYAMLHAVLGIGSLAFLGEHPEAEKWVEHARERTILFLDQEVGMDGDLVEGLSYGAHSIDPITKFLFALRNVTGQDFFVHPSFAKVKYFPIYFLAPGGRTLANIGDSGGPSGGVPPFLRSTRLWNLFMAFLASQQGDNHAQWFLKETDSYLEDWGAHNILRFLWFDPGVKPRRPDDLPLYRWFRSIGWVSMRSGWGDEDTLVAFKCGPARSHSQLDQNSFIVNKAGEWLLTDQGYQAYWYSGGPDPKTINVHRVMSYDTWGHNAIIVDGEGQVGRYGYVKSVSASKYGVHIIGDATNVYPKLKKALRQLIYLRPDHLMVIDELESDQPRQYISLLHSLGGKIKAEGDTITIKKGNAQLVTKVLEPFNAQIVVKTYPGAEIYGSYAEIRYPEKTKNAAFRLTIQMSIQGR